MSLYRLRIFRTVAKYRNVTKASEELHLSQPAISRQLKLLEQDVRVKLYIATGRGIKLTEEGQCFLGEAERLLSAVENLFNRSRTTLTGEKSASTLVVGSSYAFPISFLSLLLMSFKEMHPQVQLVLRTGTSRMLEQLVLDSEVEIAVVTRVAKHPSLVCEPYRAQQLVLFAAANHAFSKRKQLTLKELGQIPLAIQSDSIGQASMAGFRREIESIGIKGNIIMCSESPEAVKAVVRTGKALGILGRNVVENEMTHGGNLKIIKTPRLKMQVDTFIIYFKERPRSLASQEFLNLLRKWQK